MGSRTKISIFQYIILKYIHKKVMIIILHNYHHFFILTETLSAIILRNHSF